jgi:type II secretory pathway component GspD/PulD (secretin)
VQRSITYHQVGTTVKATSRVAADNSVSVDLKVEDTGIKTAEATDDAAGAAAPGFENANLTTRVSVPPGQAVVAQAIRRDGKAGKTVTLVIVTARVVEQQRQGPK